MNGKHAGADLKNKVTARRQNIIPAAGNQAGGTFINSIPRFDAGQDVSLRRSIAREASILSFKSSNQV